MIGTAGATMVGSVFSNVFTGGFSGLVGFVIVVASIMSLGMRWLGDRRGPAWMTSAVATSGVTVLAAAVIMARFAGAL